MKLSNLFSATAIAATALFTVLNSNGITQPIDESGPAFIYDYPHVYDTLERNLRFLNDENAAGRSISDGGTMTKLNLETCRRALFCLDYFNRTLTPQQLNKTYGDLTPAGVNATTVPALLETARSAFTALKIPLPKENEFPTPKLPVDPQK